MHPASQALRRLLTVVALGMLLAPLPVWAGKPHPAQLSLHDLNGKRVRLQDLRGKIVVLNFWATWCGPCNDEMPMMVSISKQYPSSDVVFVGASVDDHSSHDKVPAFIRRYHVDYPVWVGATARDLERLHMGVAVPATAFVGKDGQIIARVLGEMRPQELKQRLDWMLHGGPAPALLVIHLDNRSGQ